MNKISIYLFGPVGYQIYIALGDTSVWRLTHLTNGNPAFYDFEFAKIDKLAKDHNLQLDIVPAP